MLSVASVLAGTIRCVPVLFLSAVLPSSGQAVPSQQISDQSQTLVASEALPESPGATIAAMSASVPAPFSLADAQAGASVPPQIAPKYKRTIQPGQSAAPLTAGDKMVLALHQRITPIALFSTAFSAGYSHLVDSRPHYGTDKAGFGERLGAAELRQTTQGFLVYGLGASLFHDDPRYYVLGSSHKPVHRAIYAAERVVITRKDNGKSAINWPLLAGVASSQAIANSYYPTRDQSVRRTITGTLSTYGTTALTNQVSEFLGDVVRHFRHKPQP